MREALRYLREIAYVVLVVAAILCFILGYHLGQAYMAQEIEAYRMKIDRLRKENLGLEDRVSELEEELMRLKSENLKLSEAGEALRSRVDELTSKLEKVTEELEEAKRVAEEEKAHGAEVEDKLSKLSKAVEMLKDDKELLVTLRAEVPETREDAERFWNDTKELIERIDPNMVPMIDKILYYLDSYFDWVEAAPPENATREDFCEWLLNYMTNFEAQQYGRAIEDFRSAAYNLIISHLNEVLIALEEVR